MKAFQPTIHFNNQNIQYAWAPKWGAMRPLPGLGSPAIAGTVNTTQAWGKTGTFATTADPRGFAAAIPFNPSNPVVAFSHKNNGAVHTEIVPVADAAANGGLAVQLK